MVFLASTRASRRPELLPTFERGGVPIPEIPANFLEATLGSLSANLENLKSSVV